MQETTGRFTGQQEKCVFIPFAGCGCEIEMVAYFPSAKLVNGRLISYFFPAGFSIEPETINFLQICDAHSTYLTDDLPVDPYYDSSGYLCIGDTCKHFHNPHTPIAIQDLTEHQRAFVHHWKHAGAIEKSSICECSACIPFDLDKKDANGGYINGVDIEHPGHSRHCKYHLRDTDYSQFRAEKKAFSDYLNELRNLGYNITKGFVDENKQYIHGAEDYMADHFKNTREVKIIEESTVNNIKTFSETKLRSQADKALALAAMPQALRIFNLTNPTE